ncbi:PH domain-containing protein [Flavobacterium silvaticum]|uniref:PH domain-containing protein n=1 Tax=Flavobacterium silvaticum TaxID=1852020 RepID=A0A972FMT9_9FLAO|nr:PH domain-containing protein [Flavobacterium silvaticum]NMH28944.1 PH domain-containing protein [Flavobacterium silvaticum]
MFTNETIDTSNLPRFEEIPLTKLNLAYAKVIVIMLTFLFVVFIGLAIAGSVFIDEWQPFRVWIFLGVVCAIAIISLFAGISFVKKGFAFREHDVVYRHGIIATTTMIIPYNRVQHVALHEGFLSRIFGLAKVQVFTAGGHQSDLEIPGIAKEEAESIKQLLMSKIRKEL